MYLSDASGLGAARKWVHRRQPATGWASAPSRMAGLGALGAPVFNVPNPPRAAPRSTRPAASAPARCGRASGWQTSPQPRSTRLSKCHQPAAMRMPDAPRVSLPSSSATIVTPDSMRRATRIRISVAKRFRSVARELDGGRRVIFHCRPTHAGCADDDPNVCFSRCQRLVQRWCNTVDLCDGF